MSPQCARARDGPAEPDGRQRAQGALIVARPTKLTPAVAERILSAIRAGNFMEVAARYAGISPSTLYRWLERGDPDGTS